MAASPLLFDLDGTLWDSYPCYAAAFEAGGFLSRSQSLERLRSGENVVAIARELRLRDSNFAKLCVREMRYLKLYEGVSDGLKMLEARSKRMGIVTNLPKWLVQPILRKLNLERCFEVSIYAARKPAPTGLLKAAQYFRVDIGEIYYVGDMPNDSEAACRAGLRFAWASYGYSSQQPAGATLVINSFVELTNL
jgi:HAD superfamily hydrolase (TIGR01509 family)